MFSRSLKVDSTKMEKLGTFFGEASFVHLNWGDPQAKPGQPIDPNVLWFPLIKILKNLRLLIYLMLVFSGIHKLIRARAVAAMFPSPFLAPGINICTYKSSVNIYCINERLILNAILNKQIMCSNNFLTFCPVKSFIGFSTFYILKLEPNKKSQNMFLVARKLKIAFLKPGQRMHFS